MKSEPYLSDLDIRDRLRVAEAQLHDLDAQISQLEIERHALRLFIEDTIEDYADDD